MTDPAGVTDEMVEAAIGTYEDTMFDLHTKSFKEGGRIDVRSMRDTSMRAALTAALAGSVVVPREPSDAMCLAGYAVPQRNDGAHCDNQRELARSRMAEPYRAMIAAAVNGGA